jgi:WD40 repeat protein
VTSGECWKVLEGHTELVSAVCIDGESRVASGSKDKTVRVWNVSSGDIRYGHKTQAASDKSIGI